MSDTRGFERPKTFCCFLIASVGLSILLMSLFNGNVSSWVNANLSNMDFVAGAIFVVGFIILGKFKVNPIYVMLDSDVVGPFFYQLI